MSSTIVIVFKKRYSPILKKKKNQLRRDLFEVYVCVYLFFLNVRMCIRKLKHN